VAGQPVPLKDFTLLEQALRDSTVRDVAQTKSQESVNIAVKRADEDTIDGKALAEKPTRQAFRNAIRLLATGEAFRPGALVETKPTEPKKSVLIDGSTQKKEGLPVRGEVKGKTEAKINAPMPKKAGITQAERERVEDAFNRAYHAHLKQKWGSQKLKN
jgi:hypothetical protein